MIVHAGGHLEVQHMAKKSVSVLTANNHSVNVTGFATHKDLYWANRAAVYRIMYHYHKEQLEATVGEEQRQDHQEEETNPNGLEK